MPRTGPSRTSTAIRAECAEQLDARADVAAVFTAPTVRLRADRIATRAGIPGAWCRSRSVPVVVFVRVASGLGAAVPRGGRTAVRRPCRHPARTRRIAERAVGSAASSPRWTRCAVTVVLDTWGAPGDLRQRRRGTRCGLPCSAWRSSPRFQDVVPTPRSPARRPCWTCGRRRATSSQTAAAREFGVVGDGQRAGPPVHSGLRVRFRFQHTARCS